MKCPKQRRRRTKEEERRQERTRRRSKTYQRSRTTLELSCTVIDNRKRERVREKRTSAHAQISNASKTERFLKIEEMISTTTTYHFPNGIVLQRKQNESVVSAVVEEWFCELLFVGRHFCCSCVCVCIGREDALKKVTTERLYRRFFTFRNHFVDPSKKKEKTNKQKLMKTGKDDDNPGIKKRLKSYVHKRNV